MLLHTSPAFVPNYSLCACLWVYVSIRFDLARPRSDCGATPSPCVLHWPFGRGTPSSVWDPVGLRGNLAGRHLHTLHCLAYVTSEPEELSSQGSLPPQLRDNNGKLGYSWLESDWTKSRWCTIILNRANKALPTGIMFCFCFFCMAAERFGSPMGWWLGADRCTGTGPWRQRLFRLRVCLAWKRTNYAACFAPSLSIVTWSFELLEERFWMWLVSFEHRNITSS